MASIQLGSIVSDIRGSVAQVTYSRNQGGLFARERVTPSDPGSAAQVLARAAVTACSQYWSDTLTQGQRDDWKTYAGQYPRTDRWGNPKRVTGYLWFLAVNVAWYRTKEAIGWENPPSRAPLPQPAFTLVAHWCDNCDKLLAHVTLADTVNVYEGLQMYLSIGVAVNPGVTYYSGPWLTSGIDDYVPGWQLGLTAERAEAANKVGDRLWARIRQQDETTGAISHWYQDDSIIETHSLPGAGNPSGTAVTEGTF
ncbi:unnamed protein product, partial [marine sediment metagenome]